MRRGKQFYNVEDIERILGTKTKSEQLRGGQRPVCYACVSSSHQRKDLERQIEDLKSRYPDAIVITDIASGLNWKRPGLNSLLELVHARSVSEIVVTHRDRLARFGVNLLDWIFAKAGVKLVVLCGSADHQPTQYLELDNNGDRDGSTENSGPTAAPGNAFNELAEDLLAITNFFVARNNGLRAQAPTSDPEPSGSSSTTNPQKPKKAAPDRETHKQILVKWFGVTRFVYNQCVALSSSSNRVKPKRDSLRAAIINDEDYKSLMSKQNRKWLKEYHYDLKDEAICTYLKNLKSNFAKLAKGGQNKFCIKFKLRKDPVASILVLAKHYNKANNFFSPILNVRKMKSAEPLPVKLNWDSKLIRNQLGEYYLVFPQAIKKKSDSEEKEPRVVALDPGFKNFMIGYDPSGTVFSWGKQDIVRIGRLLHHKRNLHAKLSEVKDAKRNKRMKKAWLRMSKRIQDLVSEMHKKLALFLVQSYTHIYIPRLDFRHFKRIGKQYREKMATFSHCKFVDRLKDKVREYLNTKVFDKITEEYTSKTCTNCGCLDLNLRNKEVYSCIHCGTVIGRDFNGARNILLKTMKEVSALQIN
ncbi:hypothetical protein HDU99_008025 [Rhizoclosmatium hyalinum]|nr:hypothetical protein HDU99_008025 [Rhizoclosmatium hyalinum]